MELSVAVDQRALSAAAGRLCDCGHIEDVLWTSAAVSGLPEEGVILTMPGLCGSNYHKLNSRTVTMEATSAVSGML